MKNMIKTVFQHFLMITVGVLFFTGISAFSRESYPATYPWTVMLSGVVGVVPSFLFYFKNEPTRGQFVVRVILHFIFIGISIMTLGYFFEWYTNLLEGISVFIGIIIVYVLVWVLSFWLDHTQAKNINDALNRLNDDE